MPFSGYCVLPRLTNLILGFSAQSGRICLSSLKIITVAPKPCGQPPQNTGTR